MSRGGLLSLELPCSIEHFSAKSALRRPHNRPDQVKSTHTRSPSPRLPLVHSVPPSTLLWPHGLGLGWAAQPRTHHYHNQQDRCVKDFPSCNPQIPAFQEPLAPGKLRPLTALFTPGKPYRATLRLGFLRGGGGQGARQLLEASVCPPAGWADCFSQDCTSPH